LLVVIPAGAIGGPTPSSAGRATTSSTARRSSASGVRRACGSTPARHKRQRLGTSSTPADRLSATHPNHVWALDYQFDVTASGRIIKILHVIDEFTRESLSDLVDSTIDADATVDQLDRIAADRGVFPDFVRMDNGPELTANALRDWCRFTGTATSYIDPGSPGRTPGSSPMAPECETSCSPSNSSTRSSKPKYLSPTGERSTTRIVPTRPSACSRLPSSPISGGPTSHSSRNGWADQWGPVKITSYVLLAIRTGTMKDVTQLRLPR
jgi:Integrase core domain